MKHQALTLTAAIVALSVTTPAFAEPPSHARDGGRGARHEKQRGGHGDQRGKFLMHILSTPELAERVGLSEAQVDELRDELHALRRQQIQRQADVELAAIEQERLTTAAEIDEDAIMKALEETAAAELEVKKLAVRRRLLIKRIVSPEHMERIMDLAREKRAEGSDHRSPRRGPRHGEDDDRPRRD